MAATFPRSLKRTLREEPVDYAVKGEGPETITGLLKLLSQSGHQLKLDAIPGLVWWSDGEPVVNPSVPLIPMYQLHGNVWDLLPMGRYRAHNWQVLDGSPRAPYASIMTSLGCPYNCHFCCINAPFDAHRYRMREPAAVVAEIINLYCNHGVKTIKIIDEMFVLNHRHVEAICDGLISIQTEVKDLNIWAYSRIDTVDAGLLPKLRKAGFKWLALGIEAGNATVRDASVKQLRNNDIVGTVRRIQDANINVIGNFIFGLPEDTLETMQETLDLALELNCEWANFYCAMAYPGSPLYGQALREGWTLPAEWSGYSRA